MTSPDFDPLTAMTVVLALLLGPRVAPLASVYVTIFIGSFCGILIGLRKRESSGRLGAVTFCVVGMCLAVFTTVPLSQQLSRWMDGSSGTWFYFPVALMLAAYHQLWLLKLRNLAARLLDAVRKGDSNV